MMLRWLRWPNLILVFFTLAFIRYGLLGNWFRQYNLHFVLNTFDFLMLCLLTMMVTFSGYVINDLYDLETDKQNRPDKVIIGTLVSPGQARAIYLILVFLGMGINLYLAYQYNKMIWSWIYPLAILLLWLYSYRLKASVIWGNLLVSVFCAAVALLVPFAEKEPIQQLPDGHDLLFTLYFYAFFAGVSNMLREIIKDAEDRVGDQATGKITLAVKFGEKSSGAWSRSLLIILSVSIAIFFILMEYSTFAMVLFGACTIPWMILIAIGLLKNPARIQWAKLSQYAKLLMVGGLLGLLFLV